MVWLVSYTAVSLRRKHHELYDQARQLVMSFYSADIVEPHFSLITPNFYATLESLFSSLAHLTNRNSHHTPRPTPKIKGIPTVLPPRQRIKLFYPSSRIQRSRSARRRRRPVRGGRSESSESISAGFRRWCRRGGGYRQGKEEGRVSLFG